MTRVKLLDRAVLGAATLLARAVPRKRRPAEVQARLERASAVIDRELAGNLELVSMFMQTKQAAVLENTAYAAWHAEIVAADREVGARLDVLYERIPDAESAMERRGPAGSLRPEDRDTVGHWEGEARTLQRELRRVPQLLPPSFADRWVARLRARSASRPPGR